MEYRNSNTTNPSFHRSDANNNNHFTRNHHNAMKNFLLNNLKLVVMIICFFVTLYIQHIENISKLKELDNKYNLLEIKVDAQYKKIDDIKLDKSVFEATMTQVTAIRDDIKEIRSDIKSILREKRQ